MPDVSSQVSRSNSTCNLAVASSQPQTVDQANTQPTHKQPKSIFNTVWQGIKKSWNWANSERTPLRQFLFGVGTLALGSIICGATGGMLAIVGVPFILIGAGMMVKALGNTQVGKNTLDYLSLKTANAVNQLSARQVTAHPQEQT